jgi:alpha-L-rhamnosidase
MKNLFLSLACCLLMQALAAQQTHCEYLQNPLGIDVSAPRFGWKLPEKSFTQSAYQLLVDIDSAAVASGKAAIWNTGKIGSAQQLVSYAGTALKPFTRYFWKVTTWDEKGVSHACATAFFETGLMNAANWKGAWITDAVSYKLLPAGYFRKDFQASKKIISARAYIAVGGLYELTINGRKAGDHRLDPAYTRFDRRTLYLTHDVTDLLQIGANTIGVVLGNGWFNHQSTAVWFFDLAPWRARPKFCMDLRLTYADGTVETITTGQDWKAAPGPIVFNSIYTAEHYDARKAMPGWDKPGFTADKNWKTVEMTNAPSNNIVSQQMQPIRDVNEILPVKMTALSKQDYVFDLGQNISGVSEIKVAAPAGTTLRLVHAERITKEGRADQTNINYHYRPTDDKDPFATDIFTTAGTGAEVFRPKFNYKGFQYIEVISDKPIELSRESLKAYLMHSDVPAIGKIESSSELLNKIWKATNQSYLSNLFGYPTDCPQREKNGWTGDAHIASETGLYNFDAITVYEKWLADHRDEQQANGVLPSIIPSSGWGYNWGNGPDWTSTIAIIPWNIYLFYGDKQLLEKCYDNIKRYVDHIDAISVNGLTDWGLGDWIPIKSQANKELTSSIYYFVDANILAKAAAILGKKEDAEKYAKLAQQIREAINKKYLNTSSGIYASGFQTELSAPLFWGVVPAELKATVAKNLAERVRRDSAMDVGLLGSKTILNALSENGYADLAYSLASRESYPSWGWWINNGATTLFENWKIEGAEDISLNHIMFGEIGAWYYKALGGIYPDSARAGFKHMILKPNFVTGLQQFSASHQSPFGEIISAWKRQGKRIQYTVSIPAGSTATIQLPGKAAVEVGAGRFTYTL